MQTAILVVALVLAIIVVSRRLFPVADANTNGPERERRTGFGAGDPFHAVSIQPAEGSCAQVEAIKVQRFLSEEAPSLPLLGCASADCNCRYVHHADRRSGARDRRLAPAEHPDAIEFWRQRERRASMGRRQGDILTA